MPHSIQNKLLVLNKYIRKLRYVSFFCLRYIVVLLNFTLPFFPLFPLSSLSNFLTPHPFSVHSPSSYPYPHIPPLSFLGLILSYRRRIKVNMFPSKSLIEEKTKKTIQPYTIMTLSTNKEKKVEVAVTRYEKLQDNYYPSHTLTYIWTSWLNNLL